MVGAQEAYVFVSILTVSLSPFFTLLDPLTVSRRKELTFLPFSS
jgi:hypothetical protein